MADILSLIQEFAGDPEKSDKLKDTKSSNDVVDLLKEHGVEFVEEEVHKLIAGKGADIEDLLGHLFK